jgi:hypothetical protein
LPRLTGKGALDEATIINTNHPIRRSATTSGEP